MSPIDGTVRKINNNGKINEPGSTGEGTATFIIIESDGGLNIMLAHLTDLKVKVGDKVKQGQPVALVGNNGQSWQPHVHIGAWKGNEPLQIRFNQEKIKNL